MAKRSGGGDNVVAEADLRRLLIAAVVEHGTRKLVGPYSIRIPRCALHTADAGGKLATLELPGGGLLVTFAPAPPAPKPKR
jgi:hypothetical protein